MQRNALRRILRGILTASLPLALGACPPENTVSGNCGTQMHLSATVSLATDGGAPAMGDAGASGDLAPDEATRCAEACITAIGHHAFVAECTLTPTTPGQAIVDCLWNNDCTGRRPAGLESPSVTNGSALAEHLGRMAHLEAASVPAFERLEVELAAHGAPSSLRAAARRAAADERRHAHMVAVLARRHGGEVPPVVVAPAETRSLEAIAVENAVEGCVGETWGALVAGWQAQRAVDASVRATMRVLWQDETRHAELAWEVARFCDGKLDAAARQRVLEARTQAVAAMRARVEGEAPADVARTMGLPSRVEARGLLERMEHTVWS